MESEKGGREVVCGGLNGDVGSSLGRFGDENGEDFISSGGPR